MFQVNHRMEATKRLDAIMQGLERLHWASQVIIDERIKELCVAYPELPARFIEYCSSAARESATKKLTRP